MSEYPGAYVAAIFQREEVWNTTETSSIEWHPEKCTKVYLEKKQKNTVISFVSSICAVHHDVKGEVR